MSRLPWSTLVQSFLLASLTVAPLVDAADAGTSAARESEVFERLTRTDWVSQGCRGMVTCLHLRFLRSGTLRRWERSDYLESDQSAAWNFTMESDTSGCIRLGRDVVMGNAADRTIHDGSMFPFVLRGNVLELEGTPCVQSSRPIEIVDDSTRSRTDLPAVPIPPLLRAMCAHDWSRMDDFDQSVWPDRWHFDSTLTCELGFRGGECSQAGTFSIDGDQLIITPSGNGRDARGCHDFDSRLVVASVLRDTLTLDGVLHADAGLPRLTRLARFPKRAEGIRLEISYDGELRAGVPTSLKLRFTCESYYRENAPYRLRGFRASMRTRRPFPRWNEKARPRIGVAERSYGDRLLVMGASFADSVTIVPPAVSDEVELLLEWDYLDGRGLLPGRAEVVAPVR